MSLWRDDEHQENILLDNLLNIVDKLSDREGLDKTEAQVTYWAHVLCMLSEMSLGQFEQDVVKDNSKHICCLLGKFRK